jgi:hypothetical protein
VLARFGWSSRGCTLWGRVWGCLVVFWGPALHPGLLYGWVVGLLSSVAGGYLPRV